MLTDEDKIKALGTLGLTPKYLETTDIVEADKTVAQEEDRGIGENSFAKCGWKSSNRGRCSITIKHNQLGE
jgi:hypothetical protein